MLEFREQSLQHMTHISILSLTENDHRSEDNTGGSIIKEEFCDGRNLLDDQPECAMLTRENERKQSKARRE